MSRAAPSGSQPMIIACGALARELHVVLDRAGLSETIEVQYLPANLHNRPEHIAPAIDAVLAAHPDRPVFIGYADCGTGGGLDLLLDDHPGVHRLPGAHCYELFAGTERFGQLHDDEPGTFYLTDYLALHFDALVWQGLGLADHPELRDAYFANYRRVVLLSQSDDQKVMVAAASAASRLSLPLIHEHVGRDRLGAALPVRIRNHEVT